MIFESTPFECTHPIRDAQVSDLTGLGQPDKFLFDLILGSVTECVGSQGHRLLMRADKGKLVGQCSVIKSN
jgi:hypothetical protein